MKQRIVVGMSGGVDSSVAALLLKQQGYDVVGVFMKNWDEIGDDGVCNAEKEYRDVRSVCDRIGIPYYTVNFTKEYWDRVFTYFLSEYKRGRTPNPDVLCNQEIKFKAFLQYAQSVGSEKMATGHFARTTMEDQMTVLLRGCDQQKDQSYFLCMLSQAQLSHAIFPVGELTKGEIRAIATEAGLPTAAKKDSTGICFIGERNFKKFLQQYMPAQPGDMVDRSDRVVGRHDGLMYYTIGQRHGLGIGGKADGTPWFVLGKDMQKNRLLVDQAEEKLYSNALLALNANWISGHIPENSDLLCAKIRYRQQDVFCRIEQKREGLYVEFANPVRAIAPGQIIAFYRGQACLGGAIIEKDAR